MIVELGDGWAVALSSLTWFAVSVLVGRLAAGWPTARLADTGPLTTLRAWEASGAWWQRHLGVRRWKDRLPEAGATFAGGVSRRRIPSRSTGDLARFRAETVRAERVHWLILASTPMTTQSKVGSHPRRTAFGRVRMAAGTRQGFPAAWRRARWWASIARIRASACSTMGAG